MPDDAPDSGRPSPRTAGAVYLLYFVTAVAGLALMRGLIVPGDAARTAAGIVGHQPLFRTALAVDLLANAVYLVLTALLYRLLSPVDRGLSLAAAFISLVGCGVQIFAETFRLAALALLTDPRLAAAFSTDQVQGLAMAGLGLHGQSYQISLVLFGLFDVLLGVLIFRSTFLPRSIGILLGAAGLGWLTFLWPPLAAALSAGIMPLGAIAELTLMGWLLVRGVDQARWRQVAGGSAGPA